VSDTIVGKIVIVLLALICVAILIFTDFGKGGTIRYDCRDAHWHPDVPIEVKKQCQELMKQRIEKPTLII
jgi:hypothetical protein